MCIFTEFSSAFSSRSFYSLWLQRSCCKFFPSALSPCGVELPPTYFCKNRAMIYMNDPRKYCLGTSAAIVSLRGKTSTVVSPSIGPPKKIGNWLNYWFGRWESERERCNVLCAVRSARTADSSYGDGLETFFFKWPN